MRQATLANVGFARFGKTTCRAAFLAEMEQVVPWQGLCDLIVPFYPKPGNGRPPIGLERMLLDYVTNITDHSSSIGGPAKRQSIL